MLVFFSSYFFEINQNIGVFIDSYDIATTLQALSE